MCSILINIRIRKEQEKKYKRYNRLLKKKKLNEKQKKELKDLKEYIESHSTYLTGVPIVFNFKYIIA